MTEASIVRVWPVSSRTRPWYRSGRRTVKSHQKISATQGDFSGNLENDDWFATSTASLGDFDGDGVNDLVVGARGDDDGGSNRGAVWVLLLDGAVGPACPWDLDDDNFVGTGDLILLLGSWGDPYGTADLIELLGNWGPCPK